jgi:hypothetical protein
MPRIYCKQKYQRIINSALGGEPYSDIARRERVSKSTVARVLKRYQVDGVIRPTGSKGRRYKGRKLGDEALRFLEAFFTSGETETLYLCEAAEALQPLCSSPVLPCDISRACAQLGLTRKKAGRPYDPPRSPALYLSSPHPAVCS